MNETLLEKAKKISITKKYENNISDEEIELYLALLKEEVNIGQVRRVLFPNDKTNVGGGKIYGHAIPVIRAAFQKGKIILK